jgi:4-alpha-glucanotransferase
MNELTALRTLARTMGVHTRYIDGLGKRIVVSADTLVRVCRALGAPIERPADAATALRAVRAAKHDAGLAPVLVAWDGAVPPLRRREKATAAEVTVDGEVMAFDRGHGELHLSRPLPFGYHQLSIESKGKLEVCTVISAPVEAYRRPGVHRSWGVGTQLAALRSRRSRSLGDLKDLELLCRWLRERGGDLVTALPLLPTFNSDPAEPSPYSPVSRLFWSELILDLGTAHRPTPPPEALDVRVADREVRVALAERQVPDASLVDDELIRYVRFRGAQARMGRNWRDWPSPARAGSLQPNDIDTEESRFHLVAQSLLRHQLHHLREDLEADGMRLGLDLAVGVHPDGFDPWSRQHLFGEGMSVGAPPDQGFPSGQDWGFTPVLPEASRREGHHYIAASIAHQASLAGVLRVDHIMAWTRLYWIPHGMGLHEGTYVSYPAEELFAILTLESNLKRCEVVGENLGTVPKEIFEALPRHRIWGMYLAQFMAPSEPDIPAPTEADVAMIGTHDTPTFAGWLSGNDIGERVRYGLLRESAVPQVAEERGTAVQNLAKQLGQDANDRLAYLGALLEWLGRSETPLVIPWLEDFWLEERGVNLPGTPSAVRPNWQMPMSRLLDDIFKDSQVAELMGRLQLARQQVHHGATKSAEAGRRRE